MGNPGAHLSAAYDRRDQWREILDAAKVGPLQSLTDREIGATEQPMTIYPRPKRVRAWVRFGVVPVRVDASLLRSTPLAAGIEFRAEDQTFRCWVWGNAVVLADDS
ncbi:hypothetical protein [Microbacterium sp. Root553]|uniref:hypothetical protein n=1 Tax=Microbacterium sp. Root553 TaxID=1736556 RepID=UPI0006F9041D|nr:hypothetical protein [Microbacterium sp. Root553]KQZ22315.1 hypothetical protein ASD43_16515 [Microbacterium sp. Root553]